MSFIDHPTKYALKPLHAQCLCCCTNWCSCNCSSKHVLQASCQAAGVSLSTSAARNSLLPCFLSRVQCTKHPCQGEASACSAGGTSTVRNDCACATVAYSSNSSALEHTLSSVCLSSRAQVICTLLHLCHGHNIGGLSVQHCWQRQVPAVVLLRLVLRIA